jgi:hypothetical protein
LVQLSSIPGRWECFSRSPDCKHFEADASFSVLCQTELAKTASNAPLWTIVAPQRYFSSAASILNPHGWNPCKITNPKQQAIENRRALIRHPQISDRILSLFSSSRTSMGSAMHLPDTPQSELPGPFRFAAFLVIRSSSPVRAG